MVMEELGKVFKLAQMKAVIRTSVVGNTATPWIDFPLKHLEKRLNDEFHEWLKSKESEELFDIINLAAFVYLSIKGEGTEVRE